MPLRHSSVRETDIDLVKMSAPVEITPHASTSKEIIMRKAAIEKGSGNIFADVGLPDA